MVATAGIVSTWIVLGNLLGFVWVAFTHVRPWDRTTLSNFSSPWHRLRNLLLPIALGFIHLELTHLVQNVVGLLCVGRIVSSVSGYEGTTLGASYILGSWVGLHAGRSPRGT